MFGNHSRNFRNCIGCHWHCTEAERKCGSIRDRRCGWSDFYLHSREIERDSFSFLIVIGITLLILAGIVLYKRKH